MDFGNFLSTVGDLIINSPNPNYRVHLYQIDGTPYALIHTNPYRGPDDTDQLNPAIYVITPPDEGDYRIDLMENHYFIGLIFDDIDIIHDTIGYINGYHAFDTLPKEVQELIPTGVEQIVYYEIIDRAS